MKVKKVIAYSTEPVPRALPPDVAPISETRNKALEEAAYIVQFVLKDFWPHGENAAAALLASRSKK